MATPLRNLTLALLTAFALIAGQAGYWSLVRGPELLARPDNPRRMLGERRAGRGALVDRNGQLIAGVRGTPGDYERAYFYPDLAPVIGYASPLYGLAGIEAAADSSLHGDSQQAPLAAWWRGDFLGQPDPGRAVQLTIDLQRQRAADQALGAATGAVVLLQPRSGEILAMASHPTFDPSQLDADWERLVADPASPLINRAALALYQPGGVVAPVILAGALRASLAQPNDPYPLAEANVGIGDLVWGCQQKPPLNPTLAQAFQAGCPWPMADLGTQLGARALDQLFQDFRLYLAPRLPIPTTAARRPNLLIEAPAAALGQGSLTLTPVHVALMMAAFVNRGQLPPPSLIRAVQRTDGGWDPWPIEGHPIAALNPETAQAVRALLPDGFQAAAISGADGQQVAWDIRLSADYVLVVVIESGDLQQAAAIGAAAWPAAP